MCRDGPVKTTCISVFKSQPSFCIKNYLLICNEINLLILNYIEIKGPDLNINLNLTVHIQAVVDFLLF